MTVKKSPFQGSKLGYVGVGVTAALCLGALGAAGAVGAPKPAPASGLAAVKFTPGSFGLKDPYFPHEGNGGYDVRHYGMKLTYIPKSHHLGGTVTITATATQNLSSFNLDLKNYRVSRVRVNGADASFVRHAQELVVTPAQGLLRGNKFMVSVAYAGTPHTVLNSPIVFGAPYGWIYTDDGAFVGCEPNAASTWYPSNDHPSDRASFTFNITVPTGTKVVANGDQIGGGSWGGMDTFVWRQKKPMATYLATLGIGKWGFHDTKTAGGIPEFVAVDPALADEAESAKIIKLSGDITDYWAKLFGGYPFGSTGAIIDDVPDVGFSLETQTRPIYGFVPDPGTASHELAHQWFGDSLTVKTWDHIWLNEGFATFVSWLWEEHTGGDSAVEIGESIYDGIDPNSGFWKQSIANPKRNTMFSSAVYYRGGMTLAALQKKIGDKTFMDLMKTWAVDHRYQSVTTKMFTDLAEKKSGQDLDAFFQTWLWDQSKPPKF